MWHIIKRRKSTSIPETQVHGATLQHDLRWVVVEDSRDVFTRESTERINEWKTKRQTKAHKYLILCGVADEQTSLADSTITDNDALEKKNYSVDKEQHADLDILHSSWALSLEFW